MRWKAGTEARFCGADPAHVKKLRMNVHAVSKSPVPVKLMVDDFLLLKQSGAFAGFAMSELIDGELLGVRAARKKQLQSDERVTIKLRIEDYLRLDRAGAFDSYAGTELIDGVVYRMNPQFRPHMVVKSELAYRVRRALEESGNSLFVGTEGSVALSETDLPQPDIVLTDDPKGAGPIPSSSVLLVVEVADNSLDFDMSRKAALYARHRIPEYWVADLNGRLVCQMWTPQGDAYADRRDILFGERIEAATIEGLSVEKGDRRAALIDLPRQPAVGDPVRPVCLRA